MAERNGPAISQDVKKDGDDCLTKLSAVPVKETASPTPEIKEQHPTDEVETDGPTGRPGKAQLSSTSFEFGLNQKYQQLRSDLPAEKSQSHADRASVASELAPYAAELERKEEKQRMKAGGSVVEAEDIVLGKPGRTILDRLMSFVAKQLKKLEQMFLKVIGSPPEPEEEKELTEEEEALELMTLREQAARTAYLAARKKYKEEEEERKAEEAVDGPKIGNG